MLHLRFKASVDEYVKLAEALEDAGHEDVAEELDRIALNQFIG